MVMRWRSKDVLKRPEWSMQRALYKSMGYSDYDLERPLIGVANSWNRIVPGHYNLNLVSDYVKQGICQAGGTPIEFGVIAACDGIAQGHDGMHYILPTRDLIANDIEMMIEAHRLDAVVLLGSCDKIVPGMLMAAARLDIPAIMVVGGPMEGGCEFDQRAADITSRCAVWRRPWGCVFREVRPSRRPTPTACAQPRNLADRSSNC
jgi:dihydroxy-acid dehydratase